MHATGLTLILFAMV